MKRYATTKQVDELTKAIRILAERILELSQWQAYQSIKQNPYIMVPKMREEILAQTKISNQQFTLSHCDKIHFCTFTSRICSLKIPQFPHIFQKCKESMKKVRLKAE